MYICVRRIDFISVYFIFWLDCGILVFLFFLRHVSCLSSVALRVSLDCQFLHHRFSLTYVNIFKMFNIIALSITTLFTRLYVRVDILRTFGKHIIKRVVYLCVMGNNFASFYDFLLNLELFRQCCIFPPLYYQHIDCVNITDHTPNFLYSASNNMLP